MSRANVTPACAGGGGHRLWGRRVVLGVAAVAIATAGACGGDGDRPHVGGLRLKAQHAEWGITVCKDVVAWLKTVNTGASDLPRQAGADPAADQAAFVQFFTEAGQATDKLASRLRTHGDPDLPGGKDTAAEFRAAVAKVRTVLGDARTEAVGAPVADAAAFQAAIDGLQARIDEGAQTLRLAYAHMEKNGPARLRQLFGQRDECIPIYQDSPTGPIAVPPYTR